MRIPLGTGGMAAAVVLARLSSAARTVKISNKCSYDVWPVVSPFSQQEEAYTDTTGFQLESGKSQSVTIPSTFTGRIFARRGCAQHSDGSLVCVTGACGKNTLECSTGELGTGTNVEFRLQSSNNGQYDVIDLQNGGGWSMAVEVKPEGDNCQSISCTPDLAGCPDDKLKLQDSYGEVLGCMSACYAGLGDTAVQCCSGDYNNAKSCTPDLIMGYEYFKKPCPSSYAYFQDTSSGTVDFLCASSGDPGFAVTFCPDGDGSSNSTAGAASGSGKSGAANPTGEAGGSESDGPGQPTGTAGDAAPSNIDALTSAASVDASSALSAQSAHATSSAASASAPAPTAAAPSASSPSSSASSSSSSDEDSGEGLSNTMLYSIGGGAAVLAILVIGLIVFCVKRRNSGQAQAAQTTSDVEQGGAGTQTAAASQAGQAYNALGRSSSRRSRTALLSASESGSSDASSSEDDRPVLRTSRSGGSRRASVSSQTSARSRR